jgi:hypothetical protein
VSIRTRWSDRVNMRTLLFTGWSVFVGSILLMSCEGTKSLDLSGTSSGSIIITTVATDPSTGPGMVNQFDSSGNFVRVLKDYYSSGTSYATGSAFVPPENILVMVESTLDIGDLFNVRTGDMQGSVLFSSNLSGAPVRQIAYNPTEDAAYILETQAGSTGTIEKFILGTGNRLGNPFIPTTVSSCVLASPYGIVFNQNDQRLYVISSSGAAGRLSVYDTSGNCIQHIVAAPLSTGTPSGITYHTLSNKLIVTFATTHAIYSMDLDGTNATQIYLNSSIINTPRSITSDSNGFLYVSSSGTDTIEKLVYTGSGSATRALSGPLIGPGIFSQNATSITVVP